MSEHDPLTPRLAALAPSVDVAASRALFERRRSHPTPARRWLLPAAAVTLLIAGIVGVWALARPDHRSTVPVTPADESSEEQRTGEDATPTDKPIGDNFELLAVGQTPLPGGTVQIVTTDEDRNRALDELGADRVDVDLTRSIMVVLNVDGNACPLILEGFDLADTVWTPQFLTTLQLCEDIGITWAYVVAVDRDALGSSVTIRLPPEFGGGEATAELGIDEAGSAVPVDGTATGDEFVMLAIEETQLGFGTILVADDTEQFDQMWTESFAEAERPSVDFDHLVVAAFTLPDDACPDTLTRFVVEPPPDEGPTVWEPRFEPPPGGCRLPLITRTYVVGIERAALGPAVTFRLRGDDRYDYETNSVTVSVATPLTDEAPDGTARTGPGWRLLSDSWNSELTGLPHLAVDDGSLAELVNDAGPLDVDLDDEFVVAVSLFGNSCPPEVAAVDVEDGQVAVRFKRSPALSCDEAGIVYGFVIAIDRAVTGDVVSVLASDPAGLPAAHETTFDVRSGDVLEGGLVFQQFEPVFVDCGEVAGRLDLVVPLETAIDREVAVVVHDTDEAPLATRSIVLTTGRSEVRVPFPGDLAGDLAMRVTSIDPPAQLERTVTLTAADIADTTRRCG